MAATGSPPQQDDDNERLQIQDPNAIASHEAEQPTPQQQPPSETLETADIPNPQLGLFHQNSQQPDKEKNHLLILPEPIMLNDDTKNPSQPPRPQLASPNDTQRRLNKRKKPGSRNQRKKSTKKVENLTGILKPIPFIPKITFDHREREDVLKRLGLYDFSKIEFDRSIRTDLLVELIASYDSKKRCGYVSGYRINLSRSFVARALKLPSSKPERMFGSIEEVDLDSEVFSHDSIVFIEDFVSNWMLLHDDSWVMPTEIMNWTRCIKDGHPEKLDSASLIWYMVEKELTQGDKLANCYYASHLQCVVRSQRDCVFEDEDDGVADDGEENVTAEDVKNEKYAVAVECEDIAKSEDKQEANYAVADNGEEIVMPEEDIEEKEAKEVEEEKEEKEVEEEKYEKPEKEEKEEKVSAVQEHDIELNLEPEVEEVLQEEVKEDDEVMVEADEHKEHEEEDDGAKELGGWSLGGKNDFGDHFLQRCQSSDLNSYEKRKPEEVEDEQLEQVEDEMEEEEEQDDERGEEGFDMEGNDDALDGDGLTGNFLQGVDTNIPFGSQGGLGRMTSMDLFGTRDGSIMSHDGSSFFGNGGKRVMEAEEDMHNLGRNGKRSKTDEMWDQKPNDFGMCIDQIHQLVEHAKMMHMSKERSYGNSQYKQQETMNQLHERQNYMEMILKVKEEALQKKASEVFQLERELYLMGDLVTGYRKALLETRSKFADYRKRYALHEEPLYKDVGPGGLVLSTRELEKKRLKQEEDITMLAQNLEQAYKINIRMHEDKLLMMSDKLLSVENEVKKLKEISSRCKETQKPWNEQEVPALPEENKTLQPEQTLPAKPGEDEMPLDEPNLSAEPEEIQKSPDEHLLPVDPLASYVKESQKPLDEPKLYAKPEASQTSLHEHNLPAEPEENQTTLNFPAELEVGQNSLSEHILPGEPEENLKSPSEQELCGVDPSSHEVLQNDTITKSLPPDADESEIK